MRLDDFDPNSVDVEDQRGGGGFSGLGGGLPMGLGLPHIGCGGIVLLLIASLIFGVNPLRLVGALDQGQQQGAPLAPGETEGGPSTEDGAPRAGTDAKSSCTIDAASHEACNALSSLNKTWAPIMAAQQVAFSRPRLVFYAQEGSSGCGEAQSAMGPFYCPSDKGIYLDTDFFRQMDQQLGAGGQFARDYVIAHEYGHHIQNLLGISDKVARAERSGNANAWSVKLELQADCLAGVWAARNKDRLEAGDMESGLNAAHQIGDDTLSQGRAPESSFTHGSSAQRMAWLRKGMDGGTIDSCNTFGSGES
jgi:predicted metalloprotease